MKTKANQPKPLKTVNVPLAPALTEAAPGKSDKLTLTLGTPEEPNTDVKDYNHAVAQEKAWKQIKEDKKPKIEERALTELYANNTSDPEAPVKTVCVTDTTGASVNVTLKDTYDKANHNPAIVTEGLKALGKLDPNKFVAEKVVIGFDTSVFYDAEGNLRTDFYLAVMQTLQDISEEHGLVSPFSSSKVVNVKPGFAESRWTEFTEEQQPAVTKLFPATVSLMPLAPAKKAKA